MILYLLSVKQVIQVVQFCSPIIMPVYFHILFVPYFCVCLQATCVPICTCIL